MLYSKHACNSPIDIRTEYLENPIGLDISRPRLYWQPGWSHRDAHQTAYQIVAASSDARMAEGEPTWDTGKVYSSENAHIVYDGPRLSSRDRIYWKVRLWDETDRVTEWSETTFFEMGLLSKDDWRGKWMGVDGSCSYIFRCGFFLKQNVSNVLRARLYSSGLGYYEPRLNGSKIGTQVLSPEYSDYTLRIYYQVFDVDDQLLDGDNTLGLMLGNGWFVKFNYGHPLFRFQLEITYEDGSSQVIGTQPGEWRCALGPIIENDIYNGETYDARLERPGWDLTGYKENNEWMPISDAGWHVFPVPQPTGAMCGLRCQPVSITEDIEPNSIRTIRPGIAVVDFGQNFAGWVRLTVRGKCGTRVLLRFAELIYEDGTVNQENLMGAAARDTYVLKGEGSESWEPRFTYHGFRYVQVEGIPNLPDEWSITGRVLHSALPEAGQFNCSDKRLTQLFRNSYWGLRSNLISVPTDCPQRAERQGYHGDSMLVSSTVMHLFHSGAFFTKWLEDVRDTQDPQTGSRWSVTAPNWPLGEFAYRSPQSKAYRDSKRPVRSFTMHTNMPNEGYQGDAVWTSAGTLLPWYLYQAYADLRIIEDHFPAIEKHLDFLASQESMPLLSYNDYADWLVPSMSEYLEPTNGYDPAKYKYDDPSDGTLLSTAFFMDQLLRAADMARILHGDELAAKYEQLAAEVRRALRQEFYQQEKATFGSQTADSLALCLGFAPDEDRQRIVDQLVSSIVNEHDGHLWTGLVGTKCLLEVLCQAGRFDVAYGAVTRDGYPGWMYMLSNGATTMWERWENWVHGSMNSHNHPGWTVVSEWMMRWLGGIRALPMYPGYKRFMIAPEVPFDLDYVEASLDTIRGRVHTSWRKTGHNLNIEIDVPASTRAEVVFPMTEHGSSVVVDSISQQRLDLHASAVPVQHGNRKSIIVGSGRHCFSVSDCLKSV